MIFNILSSIYIYVEREREREGEREGDESEVGGFITKAHGC